MILRECGCTYAWRCHSSVNRTFFSRKKRRTFLFIFCKANTLMFWLFTSLARFIISALWCCTYVLLNSSGYVYDLFSLFPGIGCCLFWDGGSTTYVQVSEFPNQALSYNFNLVFCYDCLANSMAYFQDFPSSLQPHSSIDSFSSSCIWYYLCVC